MKQITLAVLAAFAIAGTCSAAVKDGTYTKTVTGHNAPITVTVDIKGGKIASIATKDLESPGVGKVAIKKLEDSVIKNQSTTIKDCLKQAGAEKGDFNKHITDANKAPVTERADVVIVGGGGAGLASAVSPVFSL